MDEEAFDVITTVTGSKELELDYTYVKEVVDLIREHPDWTDLQIGKTLIMRDNF